MKAILAFLQALAAAVLLVSTPALAADEARAQASQSHNNAPLWRDVRSGEPAITTVRGVETGVLIQSGGETWREIRNGPITLYGGILLCVIVAVITLFFVVRGRIRMREPPTGRQIERFSYVERVSHWSMAGTFVILALSGLTLLFGKHVLLPVFGYPLFSSLAELCKTLHNFVGPLFLLSIVVSFFLFVKDNVWQAGDAQWIAQAGGLFSGRHVPSWRFNFGEKAWFWIGLVVLGLTVSLTGLVMDFPNFGQGRGAMQTANVIHAVGAILFIGIALGHIYLGTIGMEGAFFAMWTGNVDETWAREHHEHWYKQVKRQAPPARPEGAAPDKTAAQPLP